MPCGDVSYRSCSRCSSPDPQGYYNGHEDKRAMREGHCGGSQYPWPVPSSYPYPSNDAKNYAPYCMPHGVMPMAVPPPPFGAPAGHMVPPQPPMFGIPASRMVRTRTDIAETSSSNCTPRDHYTNSEKCSPQKRHGRKHDAPRFPVVKIPEALKKQGQPSPAPWVNSRGFPLRVGKPDCKHYISKGWCAYGSLCKFNHPDNLQTTMPYPVMSMCPGSQPMVMNTPWMGVHYPWGGPWGQQSPPMTHGFPPYMCHPCPAGPCSTESGNLSSHNEAERATDTDATAVYH